MRAALKAYVGELVLTYLVGRAWLEFVDRVAIAKERRRARRQIEAALVTAAETLRVQFPNIDEPIEVNREDVEQAQRLGALIDEQIVKAHE